MNQLIRNFSPVLAAGFALALMDPSPGHAAAFMSTPRVGHTATLLPSGHVLVAGGRDGTNDLISAEIYDPVSQAFSRAGDLTTARSLHRATLLTNGKVLITGGENSSGALASAELYDPATQTFTRAASLSAARSEHTATLLGNGTVLITGGSNGATNENSAELYQPASDRFVATAGVMNKTRRAHTATLLADGKVLITGGFNPLIGGGGWSEAELYDPATGTFSLTTGELVTSRNINSATLLPDGKVLVVGGLSGFVSLVEAELYDPATGLFAATGNLNQRRFNETSTLLSDGTVLVAGGADFRAGATLDSTEIYNPQSGTFSFGAHLIVARSGHRATLLKDGQVLFTGGTGFGGKTLASAELYTDLSCAGEVGQLRQALAENQGLRTANDALTITLHALEMAVSNRDSQIAGLQADLKQIVSEIENGLGPPKRKLPGRNPSEKLHSLARSIQNLSPAQRQLLLKMLKLP